MKNIIERHEILTGNIGTRLEEDISYKTCQVLLPLVLGFFFLGSLLEILFYLLFNYKVLDKDGCTGINYLYFRYTLGRK